MQLSKEQLEQQIQAKQAELRKLETTRGELSGQIASESQNQASIAGNVAKLEDEKAGLSSKQQALSKSTSDDEQELAKSQTALTALETKLQVAQDGNQDAQKAKEAQNAQVAEMQEANKQFSQSTSEPLADFKRLSNELIGKIKENESSNVTEISDPSGWAHAV